MSGYVANFAVYTMAMIGLIFFALLIYKKLAFTGDIRASKTKILNIEETITIAPRKTLYIIKAGDERFLIASDVDKTTLISKLSYNKPKNKINSHSYEANNEVSEFQKIKEQAKTDNKLLPEINNKNATCLSSNNIEDLPRIVDFKVKTKQKNVLHDMLKKINE